METDDEVNKNFIYVGNVFKELNFLGAIKCWPKVEKDNLTEPLPQDMSHNVSCCCMLELAN